MAEIEIEGGRSDRFRVTVTEGRSRTTHHVRVDPAELERLGADAGPHRLVEESFRFLLEREPKESILQSFSLSVIETAFPEYPEEIRRRLAVGA